MRNAAIFLAAFATMCSGIRVALPFPEVMGVYQKWLYFKRNKDRFDVLFLGSSRFYHQVIPEQFDARVKALSGRDVRTFNFGYDGMWPPESYWMLRQLLAMKPKKLRWVFIDGMDIEPKLDDRNFSTLRQAYWHDWRHTLMAWRSVADAGLSPKKKWSYLAGHGELFLREWTNQGCGAEWLGYEFGVEKRKKPTRWDPPKGWKDNEGYEPEKDVPFAGPELEDFQRAVAELRASFPPREAKPSFVDALSGIAAKVRAAGAEPIVIITPTVDRRENFSGLPSDIPVWRYHDANEYPALYEPANHYDMSHLNDAGAKIFTDLLAERFAAQLKKRTAK
jgi:hypothetical protein